MTLLVRPEVNAGRVETFGFELLGFQVRQLDAAARIEDDTAERELCIVLLGGTCGVECAEGAWESIGARKNVFDGLPYAVYLPPGTRFRIQAHTACELAFCYAKSESRYPPRLITPADVQVEIRGGGNATRQINHILRPEFPADRLLVVEVYTPSGNWSSYPPHKHDVAAPPDEVRLEEIYYYRIEPRQGFGFQRIYTADGGVDEAYTIRDGDAAVIPYGYHPVAAAPGYRVYYLWMLAGPERVMRPRDDPDHAWVHELEG
jgi:5-deoxy-glucuronate isomerase